MSLRLAVGDGVLGEDEEVEEGDEVGHDETRPRVLEVVAKTGIYFHPAEAPSAAQTPGGTTERRGGGRSVPFSQIQLQSHQREQIKENPHSSLPPRF